MQSNSAVRIPTPEEFLSSNTFYMLNLLTGAAWAIRYNYKKLLQEIYKDEKYKGSYEALNDPDVICEVKKQLTLSGQTTEERINFGIKLAKALT